MTFHAKVIDGGKIVIPALLRHELGMKTGDTLVIERDGDKLVVKTRRQVLEEVQAAFRELIQQPFTVDDFLSERRAEAANG